MNNNGTKHKALGKGLEQLFANERIDFDNLERNIIEEAKSIFQQLIERDKEKYATEMNDIIIRIFGKPIKISAATPEQRELVELVIEEWKKLL